MADPPLSSVVNWSGVGAASPEAYGSSSPIMDPLAKALISAATLPKRAIEGAAAYQPGSGSIPDATIGPALEAAMLPMGTGAVAGVPVRAGEQVLGAGPIRAYHGSPHDFDKFSIDQAYSPKGALNFTRDKEIAQHYATDQGKIYDVNLNIDPDHVLQMEKPFSEQSDFVKTALASLGKTNASAKYPVSEDLWSVHPHQIGDLGVKAIQYPSGVEGGQMLVFDDKLIDILKKYGIAGTVPTASAAFGTASQQGRSGT